MKSIVFLLTVAAVAAQPQSTDDRAADRQAIRAHIERIFAAFIHKDEAELRATHAENWLGFLEGSREAIHGIDGYMAASWGGGSGPYGMAAYRIRSMDMAFQGDAAFVTFVAEVDSKTPDGTVHRTLRIADFYARRNGAWIQAGSDTELHPESMQAQYAAPRTLPDAAKKQLLTAREAVWRAYFTNDRAALEKLIPAETITIEPGGGEFGTRQKVMDGAAQFAKSGAKLARLDFPKTEIQCFGLTAIIYTTYEYEIEKGGARTKNAGRATEVFVFRDGQWVNPGWHMDGGK